jgi:hypothetical protein
MPHNHDVYFMKQGRQMNKNKKLTMTGLIFFVIGFMLMLNTHLQTSQNLKSFQDDSKNNSVVSESLFFTLNHIENDLNRLRKNISLNESSSKLQFYNETRELVLNLVTWLKGVKNLSNDSLLAHLPSFPNQERLKDSSILEEWKISFNLGLKKLSLTVNNLNLSSDVQKEFKKRLFEIDNKAKQIRWMGASPGIASESLEVKMNFDLINQIQKNLNLLDQTIISGINTFSASTKISQNRLDVNIWISFSMLFFGMLLVVSSILMQNNNLIVRKYKEKIKNKAFDSNNLKISEIAILNMLDQAIFYLSSSNEIIWANTKAQGMTLNKSDLSIILKNTYKDENGLKVSSFRGKDYSLDVEFLDQKNIDGGKIFCLILKQLNEDTSNLASNVLLDQKVLDVSQQDHHFDFTSLTQDTLTSMSHVFKLSGTEYKLDSTNANLCFCDFNKIETCTRTFLTAIHQLIKDDFDVKQVVFNTSSHAGHLSLSAFVPAFNLDEGELKEAKHSQLIFLDEMKKIEKNLANYSPRILTSKKNYEDNNVDGFYVELCFSNIKSPKEISDKNHVLI